MLLNRVVIYISNFRFKFTPEWMVSSLMFQKNSGEGFSEPPPRASLRALPQFFLRFRPARFRFRSQFYVTSRSLMNFALFIRALPSSSDWGLWLGPKINFWIRHWVDATAASCCCCCSDPNTTTTTTAPAAALAAHDDVDDVDDDNNKENTIMEWRRWWRRWWRWQLRQRWRRRWPWQFMTMTAMMTAATQRWHHDNYNMTTKWR